MKPMEDVRAPASAHKSEGLCRVETLSVGARRADETIRLSAVTKPKETHMSDMTEKSAGATIRPFHVNVPEAELTELRRRIQRDKVA